MKLSELYITWEKKTFHFKTPSGTSRGILTEKHSWFLTVYHPSNPEIQGVGECSIIPGLSPDFVNFDQYENELNALIHSPNKDLTEFPSIRFGFETALLDLQNGGKGIYFENDFARGKKKIPINGLIWMGSQEFMETQIQAKIKAGFDTVKMKIGVNFAQEMAILEKLRDNYHAKELEIRVDANGAFEAEKALEKLIALAQFEIHSIEQPIKAGQHESMRQLCIDSPIDIALDEELIGINDIDKKRTLLENIQPQYIILKPSLHGGISGTKEWIQIAKELNIQWWMTSALESNIGLKAIAQFTAEFNNEMLQGLGTGSLYTDNIPSNLVVRKGFIYTKNQQTK